MIFSERLLPSKEKKHVTQSRWFSSRCAGASGGGSARRHSGTHAARSRMVPDDRNLVGHQFGAANRGCQDPFHFWPGHYASHGCRGQGRWPEWNVHHHCRRRRFPSDADPLLEMGESRLARSIPGGNDRLRAGWSAASVLQHVARCCGARVCALHDVAGLCGSARTRATAARNAARAFPAQAPIERPAMATKIRGIEGMKNGELDFEIQRGGKFVLFQYCISVVVLTFRRPSGIYFLRQGESSVTKGLPFTLLSLVAGWWGIPWGPIYTIQSVYNNSRGGKDVTQAVLNSLRAQAAPQPTAASPA